MGIFKNFRDSTAVQRLSRSHQAAFEDVETRLVDVRRRLDIHEDELKYLNKRIEKLTGRLTGGDRKKKLDDSEPEPQIDEDDLNERIRRGMPLGVTHVANSEP
ncbi:MAG: hypothetical protein ACYTBJ_25300 [Planctomycetota bacterium]